MYVPQLTRGVTGPMITIHIITSGCHVLFLLLINDILQKRWIFFLVEWLGTLGAFKKFNAAIEANVYRRISVLWSNSGEEFVALPELFFFVCMILIMRMLQLYFCIKSSSLLLIFYFLVMFF